MDALKSEATPEHIEKASVLAKEITQYGQDEQVQMFNHIRQTLHNYRQDREMDMRKEHENLAMQIDKHIEGSKIIASTL